MKDYQALIGISSILVNTDLDEMTQLKCIKDIMYNWSLNLKKSVAIAEKLKNDEGKK